MRAKWPILAFLSILLLLVAPALASQFGEQWVQTRADTTVAEDGFAIFNFTSPAGNYIFLVGGCASAASCNQQQTLRLDGVNAPTALGNLPVTLGRSAYAVFDNKMWIAGGMVSTTGVTNTTYNSSDGITWNTVNASSAFAAREGCAGVTYNGKFWLTGGFNSSSGVYYQDTWFLTTANESKAIWTKASDTGLGVNFYYHGMTVFNGEMWVVGNGYAKHSTDGITWATASTDPVSLSRQKAGLVVLGGYMIYAGGFDTVKGLRSQQVSISQDGATWTISNATYAVPTSTTTGVNTTAFVVYNSSDNTRGWNDYPGVYAVYERYSSGYYYGAYAMLPLPVASATPATAGGTAPLPVAWQDISTGYRDSWVWDFRDGYFSYTQNASHVFTSPGTYNVTMQPGSAFGFNDTFTSTVSVTTQQSQIIYYTQRQVRLKAVDAYGVPLPNANITVNYLSSSLPNTTISWLTSAFGITQDVAAEMTTSGLAATGWTGQDGASNFVLFPALRYGITITNASIGLNHYTTLSPQDSDYVIYCPLTSQRAANSTQAMLGNTSLWVTLPDIYHVTFNFGYQDASGLTTTVNYSVWKIANVTTHNTGLPQMVYSIDFDPGAGYVTDSNYTALNLWGDEYKFMYNATRSGAF
jgi:PKD repeat protein